MLLFEKYYQNCQACFGRSECEWVNIFLFLYLTETGDVYAFGDNKMGQLGLGNQSQSVPSPTRVSTVFIYKGTLYMALIWSARISLYSTAGVYLCNLGIRTLKLNHIFIYLIYI